MSPALSELQKAKVWLTKETVPERWDYSELMPYLEQFADNFNRTIRDQHRAMMSQFHNDAGHLPYFADSDIGALILEVVSDACADRELCAFLYSEAHLRALWCAQNCSAGAEGMARMIHVRRLEKKISQEVGSEWS